MNSSIFDFRKFYNYKNFSWRDKIWHLMVVFSFFLVLFSTWKFENWFWEKRILSYKIAHNKFLSSQKNTKIFFLGTSHAKEALRPELFTSRIGIIAYNALSYKLLEKILIRNIPHLPKIKLCILEIDYVPIFYNAIDLNNITLDTAVKLGLKASDMWPIQTHSILRRVYQAPFFVFKKFTPGNLMAIFQENSETKILYEVGERQMTPKTDGLARIKTHLHEGKGDPKENRQALLRIINILHSRNITIVAIHYPHDISYFSNLPNHYKHQFKLAKESLSYIEYWDYGKTKILKKEDFADGDHLNSKGAKKFSIALNSRIEKYISHRNLEFK